MSIRNELANDGIVYARNIKPIFQESLGEAVSFFDSWNEQYDTMDKFQEYLGVI